MLNIVSGNDTNNGSCSAEDVYCCENLETLYHSVDAINFILLFIGLLGNIFSTVVFSSKPLIKAHHAPFLIGLNISDTVYLIIHTTFTIILYRTDYLDPGTHFPSLNTFRRYMETVTGSASLLYVFFFTLQRFLAVHCPITSTSKIMVRFRTVIAALMPAVLCAIYTFILKGEDEKSVGRIVCVVFVRVIPGLCIIAFNLKMVWSLRKTIEKRKSMMREDSSSGQFDKANRMLIIISGTFIILNLPFATVYTYVHTHKDFHIPCRIYGDYQEEHRNLEFVYAILCLIFDCNFAINFFLYCVSGKMFRDAAINKFKDILRISHRTADHVALETPSTSSSKVGETERGSKKIISTDTMEMRQLIKGEKIEEEGPS